MRIYSEFLFMTATVCAMHHGVEGGATRSAAWLDAESAATVATTLHALASPGRLLILTQLRHGPLSVTILAETVGMKQPVASTHLRVLRAAGMVTSTRHGRIVTYRLFDDQVTQFLDEAAYYSERFRLNIANLSDDTRSD
jgi:DNA-binding transcriptional ArsR family regulator